MTWQATLGDPITIEAGEDLITRIIRFRNTHTIRLDLDLDEDRPAIWWEALMHAIPEDSPDYRSAVRMLNRTLTGADGTYWQSLWHDSANPRRPQPMRYLKGTR
jgi:hypothetical protein